MVGVSIIGAVEPVFKTFFMRYFKNPSVYVAINRSLCRAGKLRVMGEEE